VISGVLKERVAQENLSMLDYSVQGSTTSPLFFTAHFKDEPSCRR